MRFHIKFVWLDLRNVLVPLPVNVEVAFADFGGHCFEEGLARVFFVFLVSEFDVLAEV